MRTIQGTRVLTDFYVNRICEVCGVQSTSRVCEQCARMPQQSGAVLLWHLGKAEQRLQRAVEVCKTCTGRPAAGAAMECEALACPWLYERNDAGRWAEHWEAVCGAQGLLPGWAESSALASEF